MEKNEYSMFCIDLRNFSSSSELGKFLNNTNIKMDADYLYSAYNGMVIPCYRVDKVWIDSVTLNFIAMESCGYLVYDKKYSDYMRSVNPIDETFSYGKIDSVYSNFCIDFTNYSSIQEFNEFVNYANLDLDSKSWFKAFTQKGIEKVWVDSITLSLVEYELNGRRIIFDDYTKFMQKSKPIDSNFKYGNFKFRTSQNLSIDAILDKILEKGIKSLTPYEKDFLQKQSQY